MIYRCFGLVGIVFALGSCGPTTQPRTVQSADEAAIRAADVTWSEIAAKKDLEAIVAYYTDDVVVLPPNIPAAIGKQAARELNRAMIAMPGYTVTWHPERIEVARSGDLGYARGIYELTTRGSDGVPVVDKGKYIEIWKKQQDGTWKVALEALNSDLPPRATAPASLNR
jgi:ketosteroid isomerase-like protein